MRKNYMKWIGVCLTVLFCSMGETTMAQAVIFPQTKQAGKAKIKEKKDEYINALRYIRTERTDEHLIAFFFQTAIERMQREIEEKRKQSITFPFLF